MTPPWRGADPALEPRPAVGCGAAAVCGGFAAPAAAPLAPACCSGGPQDASVASPTEGCAGSAETRTREYDIDIRSARCCRLRPRDIGPAQHTPCHRSRGARTAGNAQRPVTSLQLSSAEWRLRLLPASRTRRAFSSGGRRGRTCHGQSELQPSFPKAVYAAPVLPSAMFGDALWSRRAQLRPLAVHLL